MLKLPSPVFADKDDQRIVTEYISARILELLKEVLFESLIDDLEDLEEDTERFLDRVAFYLPEHYPKSKMIDAFTGLYALLESEEEFVPELVMEYLMAHLIMVKCEMSADMGVPTIVEMEQHDYILGKLHEICDGNEGDMGISAVDKMREIEDMSEYLEICFWDIDYLLLDEFTEEELRNSPVNEELGIGLKEKKNVFIVPPEWIK